MTESDVDVGRSGWLELGCKREGDTCVDGTRLNVVELVGDLRSEVTGKGSV